MAKNTSASNGFQNKKQLKKELAHNIETALPVIKSELGEKKFNKRVKKATKLLTEGLHLKQDAKKKNGIERNSVAAGKKVSVKKNAKKTEEA